MIERTGKVLVRVVVRLLYLLTLHMLHCLLIIPFKASDFSVYMYGLIIYCRH